LESDEDWQAMNRVLDNGARILPRSRGQKIRGLKHRQWGTTWEAWIGSRPTRIVAVFDQDELIEMRAGAASGR
jgi:hypothetical protein